MIDWNQNTGSVNWLFVIPVRTAWHSKLNSERSGVFSNAWTQIASFKRWMRYVHIYAVPILRVGDTYFALTHSAFYKATEISRASNMNVRNITFEDATQGFQAATKDSFLFH